MNVLRTLPDKVIIAFSGGIDSSCLLHLALKNKNREVILGIFDHKTETSIQELEFAHKMANRYKLQLIIGELLTEMKSGDSKERFWSECRNEWFNSLEFPVATGHNLDDALEWYLMTAITGSGGYYMDYSNKNVIRPLLGSTKQDITEYALKHRVEHIQDPTNSDLNFNKRNKVRHNLVPVVKEINPGIYSTIKKNIIRKML